MSEVRQVPLILPDLGLEDSTLRASMWLVSKGKSVYQGDRLLEVFAGEVTFDVVAPATGILTTKMVDEDDRIEVGQMLGAIVASDERH